MVVAALEQQEVVAVELVLLTEVAAHHGKVVGRT